MRAGQAVALPRGDGVAGEGAAVVHRLDRELGRRVDASGAGEDRLDGPHVLAGMTHRRRHDRLREELPAEHDVALFGVAGVGDGVAVVACGFGSQRDRQRAGVEHPREHTGGGVPRPAGVGSLPPGEPGSPPWT